MKKFINIFILAVASTVFLTSCSKHYLDEKPYSAYSPSTLNDSLGFEAQIYGLYNQLSHYFTYSGAQGWPSVWQVGTDIAFATQPQGIEVPYYNYNTLNSTDGAASRTWALNYQMINNCNIIIKGIEDPSLTGMSQDNKNSIDGEAKFFRAYAYNMLATCFGGVPIITSPLTAPKTDFTRSSLDSVNALIVSDLTFAAANLPDVDAAKKNSKGKMYERANKYQAMQLLAVAYLRMDKNDLAEQQAEAIINSGKFSLIHARYGVKAGEPGDYYSDMFWYGNERRSQGNTEAIWVLEQENPSSVVGGNSDAAQQRRVWGAAYYQIAGMTICDSLGGRGIARLRLDNWVLYNLYDTGDIRNSEWNIRRRYYYNTPGNAKFGQQVPYVGSDTIYKICPNVTKWYQFDPNDVFGYAMIKDYILMRLGETYLLLAEADVKQNKMDDAAAAINVLRERAHAPMVTASQMSMDFILDERARELLGEENRRMTLMRTKTLVERATRLNANPVMNPIVGLTENNELMPIPQSEIDLNKDAVLAQNPGY